MDSNHPLHPTAYYKAHYHRWLLQHDKDYAFECAVMGEDATRDKYTSDALWDRVRRVQLAGISATGAV